MKNLEKIQVIDPFTVRMILNEPESIILYITITGPISGWVIGFPTRLKWRLEVGTSDCGWVARARR